MLFCLDDFNAHIETIRLRHFCKWYSLTTLMNKPICYKNPMYPSWIDLILANSTKHFQNSNVFQIGVSNYHKIVVTAIKTSHCKLEPK